MRRLRWIFDTTPSAEARSRALRHVDLLLLGKDKRNSKTLQQIWTDGTYFFHYKTSPSMNQIRVWGQVPGKLRFWVLANDLFYVLFKDKLGDWQGVAVDEEYRLTNPGGYSWTNTDASIVINTLVVPTSVAQSCFAWTWGNFVPAYARFGGRSRFLVDSVEKEYTQPLLTDIPSSVNRETRTVPSLGMPWLYAGADFPYPYPAITPAVPERSSHSMSPIATNPNDFWGPTTGSTASCVLNNRASIGLKDFLYKQEDTFKRISAVILDPAPRVIVVDLDTSVQGFPDDPATYTDYATTITNLGVGLPPEIGPAPHGIYFVCASPSGLDFIIKVISSPVSATGLYYRVTVDHALETAHITEMNTEWLNDTLVTSSFNQVADVSYDATDTNSDIKRLYGYGYTELEVLQEVEIRVSTLGTEVWANTEVNTESVPPPPDSAGWSDVVYSDNGDFTYDQEIEVLIAGVVIYTYVYTQGTLNFTSDVHIRNYVTNPPPDISTDVKTLAETQVKEYEVIVHSLETLTGSLSITIVETVDVYNAANSAYDRVVIDTEVTIHRGILLNTKVYTATSVGKIGAGSGYPVNPGVGGTTESGSSSTPGQLRYRSLVPTDRFPDSIMNVQNYSTGSLRRFLKDIEGNTLVYCPTGQEAYWNTSSVNAIFGVHDETNPPVKWRLDGLPHVFGLYDSAGLAIDLSHLSLTNIEAIGIIDALDTWSE